MTTIKDYKDVLITWSGFLLLLGILLLAIPHSIAHYLAYLFIFQSYDVWGFIYVDSRRGSAAYRVTQHMFQAALTLIIYLMDGFYVALGCTVAWYFLVCDVLFYLTIKHPLEPFSWFRGSPFVAYFMFLKKKPAPVWAVKTSAVLGFILGLCLTFQWFG